MKKSAFKNVFKDGRIALAGAAMLLLTACGSTPEAPVDADNAEASSQPSAVVDQRWNFLLLGTDERLEFDERPYFEIGSDGSVNGFDGCNRFFGQVELGENQRIEFKQMASTRMACPNMGDAQRVTDMMLNAYRYLIDHDRLVFFASDSRVLGGWRQAD
ncbi:META domain-containing protein [Halomonas sp. CH40]